MSPLRLLRDETYAPVGESLGDIEALKTGCSAAILFYHLDASRSICFIVRAAEVFNSIFGSAWLFLWLPNAE